MRFVSMTFCATDELLVTFSLIFHVAWQDLPMILAGVSSGVFRIDLLHVS